MRQQKIRASLLAATLSLAAASSSSSSAPARRERLRGLRRLGTNNADEQNQPSLPAFDRSVEFSGGGEGCANFAWTVDRDEDGNGTWTASFESGVGADWVAIGLSPDGGMRGSDVLAVVPTSGTTGEANDTYRVLDMHVPSYDKLEGGSLTSPPTPENDVHGQDVELLVAQRNGDGRIRAVVRRKLGVFTGDDAQSGAQEAREEDLPIVDGRQHVICASGPMTTEGDGGGDGVAVGTEMRMGYHGHRRGAAYVNLVRDDDEDGAKNDDQKKGATASAAAEGHNSVLGNLMLERTMQVPGSGCADVKWTVDRVSRKLVLSFRSDVGADYVGIGLSEFGSMKGSDIAIVKRIPDGKGGVGFEVEDTISTDFVRPRKDTLQNVELLHANIDEHGRIRAVIRRDLDTCDRDDLAVGSYKQYLICASGQMDDAGDILYHGPARRGMALVNLAVDEELLFNRNLPSSAEVGPGTAASSFGSEGAGTAQEEGNKTDPGLTFHEGDASGSPVAIDVQMPGVTLNSKEKTHYMCRIFTLPTNVRTVAYESVWGADGATVSADTQQPDYLHHQSLFQCEDGVDLPSQDENGVFDCLDAMPNCDAKINYAKSRVLTAPSGIHIPLEKGTYLLLVHYDNPRGMPIRDDRSGLRLWAEPPNMPSSTTPGQVMIGNANLDSIRIPAASSSSSQQEYEIQFQISGEATRDVLPPSGVQVFASGMHMHKMATRSRLSVIRNGVHVMDAFDTLSYDFDMQTPTWKPWRLLPGDALIMTCSYRRHPDHMVEGGLRTSDEMCLFGLAFAPALPQSVTGVGFAVEKGEPFRRSFLGPISEVESTDSRWSFHYLNYSAANYEPDPVTWDGVVPLNEHRSDLCELVVRDRGKMPRIVPSEATIAGQIVLIGTFFFVVLTGMWSRIREMKCERKRRNAVIYLGQLLFGTVALPFFIVALDEVFHPQSSFDAVNPNSFTAVRTLLVAQTLLFLLELFYRIGVRAEVAAHHLFTSGLVIFLHVALDKSYAFHAVFKMGVLLMLMALTDHPVNLALLLKNLGYAHRKWWPRLCRAAGVLYIIAKLVLAGLTINAMVETARGEDASWRIPNHSFSRWMPDGGGDETMSATTVIAVTAVLLLGLLSSQMYVGFVLWKLGGIYERRRLQQQQGKTSEERGTFKKAGSFKTTTRRRRSSRQQVLPDGTDRTGDLSEEEETEHPMRLSESLAGA
uniref:DOMON domain-containing protein n=1 Tax=Pseudictyota dubia TaxID=2749911 RepID=A0A7R9W774_9STRA|mmetsp:Transcript_36785/g.68116  ORF Transcript_36785/g.68116 Transcript_36785/m.68116 type:complete len:1203 (+) Transcript_36785:409-4017(+)